MSDTHSFLSDLSVVESYYQVVAPNLISDFERIHFFHGVSGDPPELAWRSDHKTNPFPVPPSGARFFKIANKTANGVFDTALNPVWDTVAPLIIALFKKRSIKYSALLPVRFSTNDDEGKKTLGPITIWISTHPGKNTPEDARDASPHILQILENHGVQGAVTHWYEGSVEKLASLMRPVDSTNPTFNVRRTLTTALGMPLAPEESQRKDASGTLGLYFHEGSYKNGDPSPRVFGLSCNHVLRDDTSVDYEYAGERTDAAKQKVRVCGSHRFQQTINEITDLIAKKVEQTVELATEIATLEEQETSQDEDQVLEDARVLRHKKEDLARLKEDSVILEKHLKDVSVNWSDIKARYVGHVDYAPSIDVRVDENNYTRDFATFQLDPTKFKANFLGNVIDLGNEYDAQELKQKFWTNVANRKGFKFPANRLLKFGKAVTRQLLAKPDCLDDNGDPLYVVGKYGAKTGLRLGRYSALEGYICTDIGLESKEVVVYNYDKASGDFSDHGDSGALIWNGYVDGLALLHSSMPRGLHSHVTFGTPLWWVLKQLLLHYPNAIFDRMTF